MTKTTIIRDLSELETIASDVIQEYKQDNPALTRKDIQASLFNRFFTRVLALDDNIAYTNIRTSPQPKPTLSSSPYVKDMGRAVVDCRVLNLPDLYAQLLIRDDEQLIRLNEPDALKVIEVLLGSNHQDARYFTRAFYGMIQSEFSIIQVMSGSVKDLVARGRSLLTARLLSEFGDDIIMIDAGSVVVHAKSQYDYFDSSDEPDDLGEEVMTALRRQGFYSAYNSDISQIAFLGSNRDYVTGNGLKICKITS